MTEKDNALSAPVISTTSDRAGERIVWIDCEMTGLVPGIEELVESAAVVTDGELNVLGDGVDVVIKPSQAALDQMGDFVRNMHAESGLSERLDSGVSVAEAEQLVLEYLKQWVPEAGKAPIAGNSIGTDKLFITAQMPELDAHLHYRVIDVSSIKELARRWYPRIYFASPEKNGGHRALADILESIDELRYYRAAMFVEHPGPDSETARDVAAEIKANSVTEGRL